MYLAERRTIRSLLFVFLLIPLLTTCGTFTTRNETNTDTGHELPPNVSAVPTTEDAAPRQASTHLVSSPTLATSSTKGSEQLVNAGRQPAASSVDPLRVLFFGDWGKGNQEQSTTARGMSSFCQSNGCDLGLLLGDNFYPVGVSSVNDDQFITKFEEPYKELAFPFYVILGNHDIYSGSKGVKAQIDYTKVSKKWNLPSSYYQFRRGSVDFFAINSNDYVTSAEQRLWLSTALARSEAKWKVILGHHPVYSVGEHGNFDWFYGFMQEKFRKEMTPVLCQYRALYLSGHEHLMQLNELPCGAVTVVSGAAAERKTAYQRMVDLQRDTLYYHSNDMLGFGHAVFGDDAVKITFVDEYGREIYRYDFRG